MHIMTEEEFSGKVEVEGGVIEALVYGLEPYDCEPGKVRDAWMKIHAMFWSEEFQEALYAAEELTSPESY